MLLVNSVSTAILFPGGSGSLAAGPEDIKRHKVRGPQAELQKGKSNLPIDCLES